MTQIATNLTTFEEFLEWYPDNGRYELIDGAIVEMQPTGKHEEIGGFIAAQLTLEIHKQQLPYIIPRTPLVKAPGDRETPTGYRPDVLVLDLPSLRSEPLWERASTITRGKSARLLVEVVSTNWRDDYLKKFADYEELGIPEYWIVDYLGIGGRRYIGTPKRPTILVCSLVDGEYQIALFQGNSQRIESPAFPELALTIEQIFA
jgi:Uma2 family endonuclease